MSFPGHGCRAEKWRWNSREFGHKVPSVGPVGPGVVRVSDGWMVWVVRMREATNIKWRVIRWDPVFLDEAEE